MVSCHTGIVEARNTPVFPLDFPDEGPHVDPALKSRHQGLVESGMMRDILDEPRHGLVIPETTRMSARNFLP